MKRIAILGSTGSIGTQALDIVRKNPELQVVAISANHNVELIKQQIVEFSPKLVCLYDEEAAKKLRSEVGDKVKVVSGMEGLIETAVFESAEMVLTAVVGMIGIRPTVEAIKAGKQIALANKETLVCAGHIIMPLAKSCGVQILPVDSEHSAIFQSLNGEPKERLDKILLTASGGPFRGKTRRELENVDVEAALHHPNWKMGTKVTIDSSTLANKGLEVMEAKWLFDVSPEQIQVLVHPQSIVHSMVQYVDGSIIAQLGWPDMKTPIQYAFFYPDRKPLANQKVDFFDLRQLTFEAPDTDTFKALALAYEAIKTGGSMPTVFNAANEKAVRLFTERKIKYLEIADIIEHEMRTHTLIQNPLIDDIIALGNQIMEI